jgi:choline dehydrogenase-like flavoprotein
MRRTQLASIKIFWTYRFAPVVDAVKALKRLIDGEGPAGSLLADLSKVIGNLDGVTAFAARKALFGEGIPIEALELAFASEQQPNPQSRVLLGSKRDRLGMREVVVDWQPTAEDKSKAAATLRLLGKEIGRAGVGRLRSSLSDDDAWPDDFYGDQHHLGTTRMHPDPAQGVVDENCRVHTLANLYVAGSSVFPSGSSNNSTLTIVALALRLADHVKKQLM